jgi:hypothetical protein
VAKMISGDGEKASNGFAKDHRPIKRIFADGACKPVLVMAESVITTHVAVDEHLSVRMSQDAPGVLFGSSSPPVTPGNLDGGLSSPISTAPSTKRKTPEPTTTIEEAAPRRSFAISDLLSRGPSSKKETRSSAFAGGFFRRKTARVSSAPSKLTMAPKESIEVLHERERPLKRRESTAPLPKLMSPPSSSDTNSYTPNFAAPAGAPIASVDTTSPPKNLSSAFLVDEKATIVTQSMSPPSDDSPTFGRPSFRTSTRRSNHRIRHSLANSQASTLANSEFGASGMSSNDDDDTDMTSDSLFDSVRTRTTRSTSGAGARGPRIETIFDESPPQKSSKMSFSTIKDQQSVKPLTDLDIEAASWQDEETISTPTEKGASLRLRTPAHLFDHPSPLSSHPPSSPPPFGLLGPNLMQPRTPRRNSEEERWSSGDIESDSMNDLSVTEDEHDAMDFERVATPLSMHRTNPTLVDTSSSSMTETPQHTNQPLAPTPNRPESATKSSIFDWGERSDSPAGRTPPRPRTVHGKKGRPGSRSVGRRAPSALHARSQSVPVVPDVEGKRDASPPNKFGTWGAGNPPTEDWDDDFDFPDVKDDQRAAETDPKRSDSGSAMFVPQSIRDRQRAVIHNSTLLREWTYYIRVLKDVRQRAVLLDMLDGNYADTWRQVDAVITLADVDEQAEGGAPRSPTKDSSPSAPGFDGDAFEDEPGASVERMRRKAGRTVSARFSEPTMQAQGAARLRRKSVLPPNDGIFSPPTPKSAFAANEQGSSPTPDFALQDTPTRSRPRKDSEALARVVIEKFQNKTTPQPLAADMDDLEESKDKVPFDTTTLRHIVPYVRKLADEAKEAVRRTEGLYSSPNTSPKAPNEPDFNKIFRELPPDNSPTSGRRRRHSRTTKAGHVVDENTRPASRTEDLDLVEHLDRMEI